MRTIKPIQDEQMDARTRKLLHLPRVEFGLNTNMMKTMAQSPAALEGYLNLSAALANGSLEGLSCGQEPQKWQHLLP
jgi:hypothetical protein